MHYLDKSRKRKKLDYINVKNRIREQASILGGKFTTHHDVTNGVHWVDFYFLSVRESLVFYNATLVTVKYSLAERSYDKAFHESLDIRDYDHIRFVPSSKKDYKSVKSSGSERLPHVEFSNLTRTEWIKARQRELLESGCMIEQDTTAMEFDYGFGIGLNGVINADLITVDVLNDYIDKFRAKGESPFKGEPVPYTVEEILDTPSLSANVIVA